MDIKKVLTDFVTVFSLTLVVSVVVTVLWSLIVHGTGTIDWETSFRFAIVFGIVVTWIETRRGKELQRNR